MEDSWDFHDAESVRSGQLSHVPSELALFPLPTDPGGLLSLDRNSQPDVWNTHDIWKNVFAKSFAFFRQLVQECTNHGMVLLQEIFWCKQAWETRSKRW